jgi:hypothetical protein
LHLLIPGFGLLANLVCMAFYLISPAFGLGTFKEPILALVNLRRLGRLRRLLLRPLVEEAKGKAILLAAKQDRLKPSTSLYALAGWLFCRAVTQKTRRGEPPGESL